MTIQDKYKIAEQSFLADLKASSKSAATYDKYELVLRNFGEWLKTNASEEQQEVSPIMISKWKQSLFENGNKQNTIAHYLTVLRSFFKWSVTNGLLSEQPIEQSIFPVHEEIKHDIPTLEEIESLLSGIVPKGTKKNKALKDVAIITLLIESGIRVSELCNLRVQDMDFEKKLLRIHNGKGAKDRCTPFPSKSRERIKAYMDDCMKSNNLSAFPSVYVFYKETDFSKPTTRQAVLQLVKGYVQRLTGHKNIGAHDLRHAAASLWDNKGVSMRLVQKVLGHSCVQTTEKVYVQILDKEKAAMEVSKAMS